MDRHKWLRNEKPKEPVKEVQKKPVVKKKRKKAKKKRGITDRQRISMLLRAAGRTKRKVAYC